MFNFYTAFIMFSAISYYCFNYISCKNKFKEDFCSKVKYRNMKKPPSPEQTVIFTMLINLPISTSKHYFLSLIKLKYKGLIIVLTDNKTARFYSNNLNIKYIEITDHYPFYPLHQRIYPLNPAFINRTIPPFISRLPVFYIRNIVRYFILYMWLKEYGSSHNYYIFTDLRDVIFQIHPFAWNVCEGVIMTEETKFTSLLTISPQFNIQYFKNRKLMNHTVINGGLLYGTYRELTIFLHYYTELYKEFGFAGNDQSLLNYIYYIVKPNYFNFSVIVNKEATGYSRCLASFLYMSDQTPIDKTGLVVNIDGTYPTVLHQYNIGIITGNEERKTKFKMLIKRIIE